MQGKIEKHVMLEKLAVTIQCLSQRQIICTQQLVIAINTFEGNNKNLKLYT